MLLAAPERIKAYTKKGYWGNKTLLDLFYQTTADTPDNDALVDPYNRPKLMGDPPKRLTYTQVKQSVERIAAAFETAGLGKNDIILVQLPNIVESVLIYFAAARIGAIASPLSMMARTHELNTAVELTRAKAYVGLPEFHGFDHEKMVKEFQVPGRHLDHLFWAGPDGGQKRNGLENILGDPALDKGPEARPSGPNDVFTICWTSGTEAAPKGVPHTHNEWISIGRVAAEGGKMTRGFNIHGSFPLINMAGFGGLLVPWILTGGKLVLHHPFDQAVFFRQLADEDLNYTLMPPALLDTLAKSSGAEALKDLAIKTIDSGSVTLSPWMVNFYEEKFNIGVVNFFASNEGVTLFSAPRFFPRSEDRATYFPRFGCPDAVWDIPEVIVGGLCSRIVDPVTETVITETGRAGELCFAGPTMFSGYWGRPDLNETAFDKEGFYLTGDLFSIEGDDQDKYLFHGRFKDLIIRGGMNISPERGGNPNY